MAFGRGKEEKTATQRQMESAKEMMNHYQGEPGEHASKRFWQWFMTLLNLSSVNEQDELNRRINN